MAVVWFLRVNGKEHGPFSSAELKKLAQQRRITAKTEVRREQEGNWVAASRVKGLLDTAPTSAPPQVAPVMPPDPTDTVVESNDEGTPKWIWGLVSVAVLVIVGLSVFFVLSEKRRIERNRIASANEAVVKAVDDAKAAVVAGDFDKADDLVRDAIANEDATDKSAAGPMQEAIRNARMAAQARKLLTDAQRSIQGKDVRKAIESLTKVLAIDGTPDELQSTAEKLLSEAKTAISEDGAKKALMQLSDSQFADFLASQKLPTQYRLTDPTLHQSFLDLCLANKDQIEKAREQSKRQQQAAAKEGTEIQHFEGANIALKNIAVSANRKQFACSADETNTIYVWDIEAGRELLALSPPAKHSLAHHSVIAFSSDGKYLVAYVPKDRERDDERGLLSFPTVGVWDVATGKFLRFLEGVNGPDIGTDFYSCVAATPRYVIAAGVLQKSVNTSEHPIRVWDINTGRLVRSLQSHRDRVNCISISPDGSSIASGGDDRVAILWEIETGREVRLFDAHQSFVLCATFSPDGKSLLTGSRDCTARLWDVSTGQELHRWVFAPYNAAEDAQKLAAMRLDWDLASAKGQLGTRTVQPIGLVTSVDFSPTGSEALIGLSVSLPQVMTSPSNPVFLNIRNRQVIPAPPAFAARPMSTVRAVFNHDGTAALFNKTRQERVRGENVQIDYLSLVGLPVAFDPSLVGGDNAVSIKPDPKPPAIRADSGRSRAPASGANNPDASKVVSRTTGKYAWGQQSVTSMSNGDEIIERSSLAGRIVVKIVAAKGVFREKHVFGASGEELFSLLSGVDGKAEHKVTDSVGTPVIRINSEGVDGGYMRVRVRNLSELEIGKIEFEVQLLDSSQQIVISKTNSVSDVSSKSAKDATLILADADLAHAESIKFRLKKVETTIEEVDADVTEWFRVVDVSK